MSLTAKVVIDGATVMFDRQYSYIVPDSLKQSCQIGVRVVVPFGKGNAKKFGLIMDFEEVSDTSALKSIISVPDSAPLLNSEMLSLCEWMREQTFCTYFDAIHAVIPGGMNFKLVTSFAAKEGYSNILEDAEKQVYDYVYTKNSVTKESLIKKFCLEDDTVITSLLNKGALSFFEDTVRKTGDATMKMVHLLTDIPHKKPTKQQQAVISMLKGQGDKSIKEICYFTGVSPSVVTTLEKNGLVSVYEKEIFRVPKGIGNSVERSEILLTDEQQNAFDALKEKLSIKGGCCDLLYGVTGSGKTQVFLKLVDQAVDSGKGVILMVPEISLTPQTVSIFTKRYGDKVAVFHSAMSSGQRTDEWKRVKSGKAQVAIGTRSAVFAPFDNLGLIIMDEEQEHTYKSEQSPRFHARNIAKFRANYNNCLLLLASATPSVESYSAALNGKYGIHILKNRYGKAVLPSVVTVDMRAEILSGNSGSISRLLYNEIKETLDNKKQAILLLNRRGYRTYISCPSCGYVASCPNCSISLTYHSANSRMMCHYCGYSEETDKSCPTCGQPNMRFYGMGTQKVEEELESLFPNAKILRMDADSTLTRNSFANGLTSFSKGEYDIMLGTQMVAKGLDFPNVTLVGVIGADQAMYSEDYRSFERTFSLLTQVVGRAGRGETPGKAVIQTLTSESEIINLAVKQDYDAFYQTEILTRQMMTYPPYCDIVVVAASSSHRDAAQEAIEGMFENIKQKLENSYGDVKTVILGPAAASVPKVSNRYRFRMIIKCRNSKRLRELLRTSIPARLKYDTHLFIDINPESII